MVLILHIRLVDMEYCAFILLSSLPAAWIVAGCLVLVLSLVMGILFMLKSREVITLKKQCEDLRETMRMMRYEEANLARMLHTASKPKEELQEQKTIAPEVSEDDAEENVEMVSPIVGTQMVSKEDNILDAEQIAEDLTEMSSALDTEEIVSEDVVPEEVVSEDEDNEVLPLMDATESEPLAEETTEEIAQPTAPIHKHPINERRPAIPTDLFAAWFAENEEEQEVLPAETAEMIDVPLAESAVVEKLVEEVSISEEVVNNEPVVTVVEETAPAIVVVEEPVLEKATMDTPVVKNSGVQENIGASTAEESQGEGYGLSTELNKEDERFCRKLERIVSTRLRNPNLNIDIIAAQFGVGRTNFYRKVRELMGMSPNDYLRKCRMERAAEMLRSTELPVSDVCVQVGIPDAQYFSRVFKTHFGVTPSAYRENNNQ